MVDLEAKPRFAEPWEFEAEAIKRRLRADMFGVPVEPIYLGRFRVLRVLGRGGMGAVYAAQDDRLGRVVALKVLRRDTLAQRQVEWARLIREARALARLSHPNIVHVYEVDEQGDNLFIAMEYVAGVTLTGWLATSQRPLAEVLATFIAAGRGLAAAHLAGLTHRDVKPDNILVGDDGRVCIVDFGLARATGESLRQAQGDLQSLPLDSGSTTNEHGGTPAYMSPEHLLGRTVDAHSDQFSFCVALYEALHGQRPYQPHELFDLSPRQPPPVPDAAHKVVPRWLRRLLHRGLEFDPAHRFATLTDLLDALEQTPRRRRGIALSGLALALTGTLVALLRVPPGPAFCADAAAPILAVWGPEQHTALHRSFATTGLNYAPGEATRLTARLDAYVLEWQALRSDACEATHVRGGQSPELMDRSMLCLERAQSSLEVLLALLDQPEPALVASASEMAATLPELLRCRDPEFLTSHAPLPTPNAQQIERDLDMATFRVTAHLRSGTRPIIERALNSSRRDNNEAGEARALLLLGQLDRSMRTESKQAIYVLYEALASASIHDDILWSIWNELALLEARDQEDLERAAVCLANAHRVAARRSPMSPRVEATLLDTESRLALARNDPQSCLTLRRVALEILQANVAADDPQLSLAKMAVANALAEAASLAESRVALEALLVEQGGLFGGDHPLLALTELSLGLTYFDLQLAEPAREHLTHARSLFGGAYGLTSVYVASTELALSQVATLAGELDTAIAHATLAEQLYRASYPATYSERISAIGQLAALYLRTNNYEGGLRVSRELLALADEEHVEVDVPGILRNIGDYLCLLDRCDAALPYYARLAAHLERYPSSTPGMHATVLQGFARAYLARGDPARALPLLREAHRLFQSERQLSPHMPAQTARLLAQCLQRLREAPREARRMLALAKELEAEIAASEAGNVAGG